MKRSLPIVRHREGEKKSVPALNRTLTARSGDERVAAWVKLQIEKKGEKGETDIETRAFCIM